MGDMEGEVAVIGIPEVVLKSSLGDCEPRDAANLGVNSTKDVFSVASYVESLVLLEEGHEVLGEAQKLVDKAEDSDRVTMEGSE
ncbi:hypothetical protein LguiB_002115 [Lonicera macranthoides]